MNNTLNETAVEVAREMTQADQVIIIWGVVAVGVLGVLLWRYFS